MRSRSGTRSRLECDRVVAFGSTSVEVKRGSADPRERDVAQRLRAGEGAYWLRHRCERRTPRCCVSRWSTVPAAMRRLRALRRWRSDGTFSVATQRHRPPPARARGRSGHGGFRGIGSVASHGQTYALPGGETWLRRWCGACSRYWNPAHPRGIAVAVFNLALAAAKLAGGTGWAKPPCNTCARIWYSTMRPHAATSATRPRIPADGADVRARDDLEDTP
jgi:hypothetical protein